MLGYTEQGDYELNMQLVPNDLELETVNITASKDKKRKKQLAQFKRSFLGEALHAAQCKILNPGVIHFHDNDDQVLTAWAHDLIQIDNQAMGYKIYFSLDTFYQKRTEVKMYTIYSLRTF